MFEINAQWAMNKLAKHGATLFAFVEPQNSGYVQEIQFRDRDGKTGFVVLKVGISEQDATKRVRLACAR